MRDFSARLSVVAMTMGLLFGVEATAQHLGDVVEESATQWLIGDWVEVDNDATTVSFHWELTRHVIVVEFASGTTKARGLITYQVSENIVRYVSADNRGATGTGRWEITDSHPTLLYKQTAANGKVIAAGFVHRRIDDKTMVIEIYELDDQGALSSKSLASARFARR